jgi:NAD(P)H-dependent FMN reductase
MTRIMIIVASVRPGRIGLPIAEWVRERVEASGHEVDFADLAEVGLPFLDESVHPAKKQYEKPHTLAWSERVESAEAFVLVTPEYNHSFSPALKNALDFLFHEWSRKPVAFVSYGGVSGGLRGVTALEPVLLSLGMVRTMGDVIIPGASRQLEDGALVPDESRERAMQSVIAELATLAGPLAALRG